MSMHFTLYSCDAKQMKYYSKETKYTIQSKIKMNFIKIGKNIATEEQLN